MNLNLFLIFGLLRYILSSDIRCRRPNDVPCCYNEYFDPENNTCRECNPGRIGWGCKEACKQGYYGNLCRLSCTCIPLYCNPVVGCVPTKTNRSTTTSSKYSWDKTNYFDSTDSTTKHGILSLSSVAHKGTNSSTASSTNFSEKRTAELKYDSTTKSAVSEIFTTMHARTMQRANTRKDEKGQNVALKVTSRQHDSIHYPDSHDVNSGDNEEIFQHISRYLQLISTALFLIVSCIIILILLLLYYTWKNTRKTEIPIGMKQLYASTMNNQQSTGTMGRGYTPLSNTERQVRRGRQSDYSTPQSLDVESYSVTV